MKRTRRTRRQIKGNITRIRIITKKDNNQRRNERNEMINRTTKTNIRKTRDEQNIIMNKKQEY